uniref:Uncharacterized protein n=1 Tax=Panagrolaimus sp. JU765 TaxID=591449 RepID=A0AC34R0G6_9BILA
MKIVSFFCFLIILTIFVVEIGGKSIEKPDLPGRKWDHDRKVWLCEKDEDCPRFHYCITTDGVDSCQGREGRK